MARNNNEQRNIAINFQTNVSSTIDQLRALQSTLDENSSEYSELTQQIEKTEQALKDYDTLLESNIATEKQLTQSKERLQKQFASNEKIIRKNTTATKDLTKEVTTNGGAMSILDTLTGGLASQFKNAYEASGLFQGSLKGIRGALVATGVGAFVVLLGLLISNWDKVTAALDRTNKAQKAVNDAMRAGASNIKAEVNELQNLLKIARNETASKTARLNAIKAINAISPEYLGNITLETINTKDVNAQIERYIDLLIKKSQVQALEESIVQVYKDQAAALQDIADSEEGFWGQRLKGAQNLFNGLYDTEEVYNNKRVNAKEDADKKVQALNNQLTTILSKSPGLIFQETKKANDKIVTNTKTTNKQVQESDEDRHKKWTALQEEKEKTLERIKDLTIETAGQPSAVALNESQKKIATYYAQWGGLANGLANQLREGVLNVETFDSAIKDLDSSYETLIKNEENYQDDIQKRFGFITSFIQDFENIVVVGGGNTSIYQTLRADLIDLSNDLRGPVKEAFDTFYDIDTVREDFDSMSRFFDEVVTLDTDLKSFSDTEDGIVIQALFGKKSKEAINEKIEEVRDANEQILLIQESLALNIASTEEETERVREYYRDLRAQNDEEAANQSLQLITNTENQRRDIISASAQAQMSLIDAGLEYASEADRERIKSNGAYKAAMIGLTLIDTYTSAMSAYKGMVAAIPGPWGIAAGVAAAVSSVATGLSNVKKIAAVKIEGASNSAGAGAAASAGAAPNVSFVSSSENQIANSVTGAMNNQNQEPIKAYVVSSDVSSGQALERNKIESNSI